MIRRALEWLLGPIFDFAGDRMSDRETAEAMALGGADLTLPQQLRGHTTGARPTDLEIPVHGRRNDS